MKFAFDPAETPSLPINGSSHRFPVHRIYCVGRNYADHAREMGGNPEREPPFFFAKPADAIVESGTPVPYPPRTSNLHHEIELVVAIGREGKNIPPEDAGAYIFGYAVGNDLTRRDLQFAARDIGRPWDTAKGFDHSAPITAIHRVEDTGILEQGEIWLTVNDEKRQTSNLDQMIWSVPEIIAELSQLYTLKPGDLIFTGTPSGVGPLVPGDEVEGGVELLGILRFTVVETP
jgi:fumarylpyruvate hydrolase